MTERPPHNPWLRATQRRAVCVVAASASTLPAHTSACFARQSLVCSAALNSLNNTIKAMAKWNISGNTGDNIGGDFIRIEGADDATELNVTGNRATNVRGAQLR